MCLAIPAKILKKIKNKAKVDFGNGTIRDVNISFVDVKEGEYVIVHAGFAIQVLDVIEAKKTLEIWEKILK